MPLDTRTWYTCRKTLQYTAFPHCLGAHGCLPALRLSALCTGIMVCMDAWPKGARKKWSRNLGSYTKDVS
jgi:hypothetical protein